MNTLSARIIGSILFFSIQTFACIRIGHRGACGYAPENTLASFAKAIELNVEMIEFDVYTCASGELMVIHDVTLERTTNGNGCVEHATLTDLKELDAGEGERIPTLIEVIEYVNRRAIINIELKGFDTASAVVHIIQYYVMHKGWTYDDFLVSSFNHRLLMQVKQEDPAIHSAALLEGIPVSLAAFAQECQAEAIGVSKDCLTQEYIDDAHRRDLSVYVYTVDDMNEIEVIKNMGVDGIFSNYPDRV